MRPKPGQPGRPQVVVLDHGMYIKESDRFRIEYCELWKAMVLMDHDKIKETCSK